MNVSVARPCCSIEAKKAQSNLLENIHVCNDKKMNSTSQTATILENSRRFETSSGKQTETCALLWILIGTKHLDRVIKLKCMQAGVIINDENHH